jgi:hypothetical protein
MSALSEAHVSAAFHAENVAVNATTEQLQAIVSRGPRGALAVAGLAVAVLLAIWLLFFFVVFVPRGAVG